MDDTPVRSIKGVLVNRCSQIQLSSKVENASTLHSRIGVLLAATYGGKSNLLGVRHETLPSG